ncbi:MAG TPA: serine/threonine-protein kinase [bacterium]|nr:serine/threonine-protein kinase [bacterium]
MSGNGSLWKPDQVILDEYRVDRIIGRGGAGEVYRVQREMDGEWFAVKTLRTGTSASAGNRRLFIRELRTWIDLPEHPHIAGFRFYRSAGNRMAIFSEYVDGGSLDGWVRERKLTDTADILDVAIQIAWGLGVAHAAGVVHQDVKPANVLLTSDRVAKITDFGLAKACHTARLQSGSGAGTPVESPLVSNSGLTPAYCSPEQGNRQRLSHKTDIWSYGLTILEMFHGPPAWVSGAMANAILTLFLRNMPHHPYPIMPAAVADVLRQCFAIDPDDRWTNMFDIADALTAVYQSITGTPYFRLRPPVIRESSPIPGGGTESWRFWRDPKIVLNGIKQALKLPVDNSVESSQRPLAGSAKSRALVDLERFEEAEALLAAHADRFRESPDILRAALLLDRAKILITIKDNPGAVHSLERAEEFLAVSDDASPARRLLSARIVYQKGIARQRLNRFREARDAMRESVRILAPLVAESPEETILSLFTEILIRIGDGFRSEHMFAESLTYYDRAIVLLEGEAFRNYPELRDKYLGIVYCNKSISIEQLEGTDQSLPLLDRAIEMWELLRGRLAESERKLQLVRCLANKASRLSILQRSEESLDYIDRAIGIWEQLIDEHDLHGVRFEMAMGHMARGNALLNLNRVEEALEASDRALGLIDRLIKIEGRTDLLVEKALILSNRGITFQALKRSDDASSAVSDAADILEILIYRYGRRDLLDLLSQVLALDATYRMDMEAYAEAEQLFRQIVNIHREHGAIRDNRNPASPRFARFVYFAVCLARIGHREEAREVIGEVMDALPDDAVIETTTYAHQDIPACLRWLRDTVEQG